jgi:peptidoglycan/xylan/chitin deacetylase (PgdA/CDA1 family)
MSWLDPVRAALDDSPAPCAFFFRDDDAGWGDVRLFALLDVFDTHAVPVDVAVIPTEVTPVLAQRLGARARSGGVRLHQHGYAHVNHETTGRKHEFGPSRDVAAQTADVARGRRVLRDAFGELVDDVFTPPWNRCTPTTGEVLRDQGISILSRDVTAPMLDQADLLELPITIDWFGHHKGQRWSRGDLAARIAGDISTGGPVGVMLHHGVTDAAELSAIEGLVGLVGSHPRSWPTTIVSAAEWIKGSRSTQ